MKCDACQDYSAEQRYFKNNKDGMYCDRCYVKYLMVIRELCDKNVKESLESEVNYLMDLTRE